MMEEQQSDLEDFEGNGHASVVAFRDRGRIKSSITVHDLTQVETIFDYSVQFSHATKKNPLKKVFTSKSFEVEAYIFLPQQVGINSSDYLRSHFYSDLRPLLRLREPRFSYKEFLGGGKKKLVSPLNMVLEVCDELARDHAAVSQETIAEAINEVRVFAVAYSSYFIKRINRRCRQLVHLQRPRSEPTSLDLQRRLHLIVSSCDPFLKRAFHLRVKWARGIQQLQSMAPKNSYARALLEEMKLADEYCHYRFCDGLSRFTFAVQQIDRGEYSLNLLDDFAKRLKIWVRYQRMIARQRKYFWLEAAGDSIQQERYLFRKSLLKKRMGQVFYLSIKPRSTLAFQQQVGYMVAAGFAAAWAFVANIMIWQELRERQVESVYDWRSLVSYSGLFLILAVIIAYMFQDRIKEWGRAKFRRGVFGNLPDLSERIWAKTLRGERIGIGVMHESVDFLEHQQLPVEISAMRSKLPPIDMTGKEKVIRYRKTIIFSPGGFEKLSQRITVVRDIIRLNITRFLAKLDDPVQMTLCFRRDGSVEQRSVLKVYHLDMLLRYSSQNYGERMKEITVNYNRLAFNKNGLMRVEVQEEEAFSL